MLRSAGVGSGLTVGVGEAQYLPSCAYFALLVQCDVFVVRDDDPPAPVRARISDGRGGVRWLTVPLRRARPGESADPGWEARHLATVRHAYAGTPHVLGTCALLTQMHPSRRGGTVTQTTVLLIEEIARRLGWTGRFVRASALPPGEDPVEAVGGTRLVTARDVPDRPVRYARGRERWIPGLSVVDAFCHLGPDSYEVQDLLTASWRGRGGVVPGMPGHAT